MAGNVQRVEKPNALVVLLRGCAKRCPRCGQGGLFRRWWTLADRCPRCRLPFERGEGYWLGAMAVNLGATELVFGLVVLAIAVPTWPDVPWGWLTAIGIAVNALFPIFFYPYSKTIFIAIDLLLLHAGERAWHAEDEPDLPIARAAPENGVRGP